MKFVLIILTLNLLGFGGTLNNKYFDARKPRRPLDILGIDFGPKVLSEEIVTTPLGKVQGFYKQSFDDRTFLSFEGIPYAKPPVGDLRFAEPQAPEKWTGTLVADKSYTCWTYSAITIPFGPKENEDCLYLNVYVPRKKINGDENLDVIVNIHAGAFMMGSPALMSNPAYIMDEDVVVITFNYRLGIFGFLSTEDDVVPGNNGLKDQNRVLIWVKENIKYFGGNPDSVTLTGLSAGACSVHYHYLSPMSNGLFHRGMAQSGNVLLPWALVEKPLEKAKKVANRLNCPTNSTRLMIDCLKTFNADDIKQATRVLYVYFNSVPNTIFGPTLEHTENPFLPDHPYKLLKEGKVYDVPLITSNVKDEGIYNAGLLILFHKLEEIDSNWNRLLPYLCDFYDTVADEDTKIDIANKVKEHYFQKKPLSANTAREFIKLFSDRMFFVESEKAVRLHAKAVKSPLYYYWYSYITKRKAISSFGQTGVAHSDDNRLFLQILGSGRFSDPEDIMMMKTFIGMLASYAKTGIPSVRGVDWKPVTPDQKEIDYLEMASIENINMKKRDTIGDINFWSSLPIQENDKLF